MNKRIVTYGLALLLAAASFSCGKAEPQSEINSSGTETTTAEETTEAAADTSSPDDSTETTTKKKSSGSGLGFGMMGYVNKSKQATANADAKSLYNAVMCVFTENNWKCVNEKVYTGTALSDDFQDKVLNYYEPINELEYIIIMNDNGIPESLLCCKGTSRKDKIGIYGDVGDADEIREMKWKNVLEKFGFEYGSYTDIEFEEIMDSAGNNSNVYEEPRGLDLDDPDVNDSCTLAATIGWEFNRGFPDTPMYLYGKWSKDTPFTADFEWEVPKHGDIEYILETNGLQVINVYCWDCDRDKKYVGDANCGFGYLNFADKTWDDVLDYYGYTQGKYVEY